MIRKGKSFEFAPTAASKLLKSMTVRSKDDYTVDRLTLERLREAIPVGEKALGGGETILEHFAKLRSVMEQTKVGKTDAK